MRKSVYWNVSSNQKNEVTKESTKNNREKNRSNNIEKRVDACASSASASGRSSHKFDSAKLARQVIGAATSLLVLLLTALSTSAQSRKSAYTDEDNPTGLQSIYGTVVVEGSQVAAAGMTVHVDGAGTSREVFSDASTDINGHFTINSLGDGTYWLSVRQPGYESTEVMVHGNNFGKPIVLYLKKLNGNETISTEENAISVHELSVPEKARTAVAQGISSMGKNNYQAAEKQFQQAVTISPSYYEAYFQLGLAEMHLAHLSEAESYMQKAIDLSNGRYSKAQFVMGAILCQRHDYANAERSLRRGEELDANSWQGPAILGQALFGLNRLDEAEESEREALRKKPDIPLAYIVLGNIHLQKHNPAMVVQDMDNYLKLEPNSSTSEQARHLRDTAQRTIAEAKQTE